MDRPDRGTALVLLGVTLLVATLAVGALTAPTRGVATDDQRRTLVGSQGGGTGWHEHGSVYLLEDGAVVWREASADSYFDATLLPDGQVVVGFMHSGYESGCSPYGAPCTKTGYRILDGPDPGGEAGSEGATRTEPSVREEYAFPVRSRKNSEVHVAERLPGGEFLLADMDRERVFAVEDGEVTWQWNASAFYEAPDDPTRRDWLHVNDVDAVNGTHYLVSVRNANQILLLERGTGVVEVVNADLGGADSSCLRRGQLVDADGDGDVRCGDPDVINHQHNPQWLDSGALLVADSDNDRVVELHRNESTGRWEPAWTLTSAGGIELDWPRDADRLANGNTLVTDTMNKRVFEVTPNGTVVWSVETPRIPYEADRLPEGETVGAARYGGDGRTVEDAGGDVPGLSLALVGLRAALPGTPFWFREPHLGLTLVSLVLVVGGGLDRRVG